MNEKKHTHIIQDELYYRRWSLVPFCIFEDLCEFVIDVARSLKCNNFNELANNKTTLLLEKKLNGNSLNQEEILELIFDLLIIYYKMK